MSKWLTKHLATLKNTDYLISKEHRSRVEMATQIFKKLRNENGVVDLAIVLPFINDFVPLSRSELALFVKAVTQTENNLVLDLV